MLKAIGQEDLNLLQRFSKSFANDCVRHPYLRFSDPVYTLYNIEFLHRLPDTTHYTPLPPTQEMLKSTHTDDWLAIFRHCDLTNFALEDLCRMSSLTEHTVCTVLSRYQPLTSEFIQSNHDWMNWEFVSMNERISVGVLLRHETAVDWIAFSRQARSVEELLCVEHLVDWDVVVDSRSVFDVQFVHTFQWTINFAKLSTKILSPQIIVQFADYLDMGLVSQTVPIDSIHFVDTVKDVIDWSVLISSHKAFSPEFVAAFYRYIDFDALSSTYLDTETLDRFANVLNWTKIHRNKRYSHNTRKQFATRMWWDKLLQL